MSMAGSSGLLSPPSVRSKPTQASHHSTLTHTSPRRCHGAGPLISPWKCMPKPAPWKSTWTPPSSVASNENGENTNRASKESPPFSDAPLACAWTSSAAPTWAVFDVSAM